MQNGFPPGGPPPVQNFMRPPPGGFPPFMPPGNFAPLPGMPMPTLPPGGAFPPFPPPGMNMPMPMPMPNFPPQGTQGMPPPTLPTSAMSTSPYPPGFRLPPPQQGMSPANVQSPSPSSATPFVPPSATPPTGFVPSGGPANFNRQGPGSGPGMFPPRPNAPGLGFQRSGGGGGGPMNVDHQMAGLPRQPSFTPGNQNPNMISPPMKTMKVFVGGIAPGVTDQLLIGLFNTCGRIHKLNRVTGPSGKPQAFGFAEFAEADILLRAVKCLNGVTLPDITPQGRQSGASKTLIIKADAKENAFLDEFQSTFMRTDADEKLDADAKDRIQVIVKAMHDPKSDLASIIPSMALNAEEGNGSAPNGPPAEAVDPYAVPEHLKDLDESELPENQREVVLDQISLFREQAVKREQEKKRLEDEKERMRASGGSGQGGYGGRQWGGPQAGPSGSRDGGYNASQTRPVGNGPQGYTTPVGFVKAQDADGKAAEGRTDEEEEEIRQRDQAKRKALELSRRLQFVEQQEHHLLRRLNAEVSSTNRDDREEQERRENARAELAYWDDDRLAASGREIFFADRGRWRYQRQARRAQEYKQDVADRQKEAEENARAERETEELMKQQLKEMEEIEEKNRAAGHLTNHKNPIKLAIAAETPAVKSTHAIAPVVKVEASRPKPALPFGGADDDDENAKKKRSVIKLDEDDGMTTAERAAAKKAKLATVKAGVPTGKAELWKYKLRWEGISEATIETKITAFVRERMTEYLGELDDDDLVIFVIDKIKAKAAPAEIQEGVEPVLDEDAESFVVSLWRSLAFESAAYSAGLDTGSERI